MPSQKQNSTGMLVRAQRRTDLLMLAIGIFVLAGGIMIFRSFAAHKVDTTTPGNISMNDIQSSSGMSWGVGRTITYSIAVREGLKYCFIGTHGGNAKLTEIDSLPRTPASNSAFFPTASGETSELLCLNPTQSSNKAEITFGIEGSINMTNLVISPIAINP
jgi:hypothetical protein